MEEEVKYNVDALLFKENHFFGIGTCLRDAIGHFIKAKVARHNGVPLPNEVEACGLKKSIIWL